MSVRKKKIKQRRWFDVLPDGREWIVAEREQRNGHYRRAGRFALKRDAVPYGIKVARKAAPSSLVIHKRDGTIQEERTYGNDPHPPRG